jgi:predicted DNA-binding protein (UPF0251 family)
MQGSDIPEGARRRGRPRVTRRVELTGRQLRCYAPQCSIGEEQESITLLPEELELLKLIDLNGLEQEEASAIMGISRRTAWKDLHGARRKVADALVHGKVIEIAGCELRMDGLCPKDAPGQISQNRDESSCRRRRRGSCNEPF